MKKHADIVRPKFEMALKIMQEELGEAEFGEWTKPRETFPYGIDLEDRNIRIAPTCLSIENLSLATKLFCLCVKIVTIEKILEPKVFEDSSSKI